jgi:hypothetical protein
MRFSFGFLCALALGSMPIVGCTDEGGTGGSGGTGGMPECEAPEDCDDGDDCTADTCAEGMCQYAGQPDGTECLIPGEFFATPGLCVAGSCTPECEVLEGGSPCRFGDEMGVCVDGACQPRCENDADCTDFKDCTADTCLSNGLCESVAVQDGTLCAGGTCQSGECDLESAVVPCTEQGIRNAIAAGGDTPYTFDCPGSRTVVSSAVILIDNDVILDGEGNLTIDGDGDHNVFLVAEGATALLRGFVVTNGFEPGGGIVNRGNLTVESSTVSGNNVCSACSGLGILNEGTLMLANSTVSENGLFAEFAGGIRNGDSATAIVTNCTVSNNMGTGIENAGTLTVTNTTVSGNAGLLAGGILNRGGGPNDLAVATVTNSTVSGNTGGGLSSIEGTLTVVNSTVSGNTGGADIQDDIVGIVTLKNTLVDGECSDDNQIVSDGYNIESPGNTCAFNQTGDQPGVTAEELNLGPLADNGGPTMTHKPGDGGFDTGSSAAIDQIPEADCQVTEDQRGEPRPDTGGTMCDVGSIEVQP